MTSDWIWATGRTGSARLLETLLAPASGLYLLGSQLNRLSYKWGIRSTENLPAPVVSVGNLSVGGTGKTPFAAYLARGLKQRGLRPVLLSRGYGRQGKQKILSASDGEGLIGDPASVGDEPALLAEKTGVPVMVSADRAAAGRAAWKRFSTGYFPTGRRISALSPGEKLGYCAFGRPQECVKRAPVASRFAERADSGLAQGRDDRSDAMDGLP